MLRKHFFKSFELWQFNTPSYIQHCERLEKIQFDDLNITVQTDKYLAVSDVSIIIRFKSVANIEKELEGALCKT
jgi:hypothetical protein